ncbi:MAG TPA: uracil phosphoribosyltransferase [Melioribacteraceae bacterium]|nr:uracil phosphoribosyltransferase [Melioribacteraceae bacterium]
MFYVLENPLVKRDITYLRDKETKEYQFRLALKRISFALAIEVGKHLDLEEREVITPLEKTKGFRLKYQTILIPVLRSGLSMVDAFTEMIPDAKVGHIGLQRDEKTLLPIDYYYKTPKNLDTSKVLVLDPMLATGGSAVAAIDSLKKRGACNIFFVSLIAAPEGVKNLRNSHSDVKIFTASLDRELNENGFILPGLGDAGDRTFGTI